MQIGFAEDGYSHVCAVEFGAVDVGQAQVDITKLCSLKIYVGEVAAEEFDSTGLGFAQVRAWENGFGQVGAAEIGFVQIGAGKICAGSWESSRNASRAAEPSPA